MTAAQARRSASVPSSDAGRTARLRRWSSLERLGPTAAEDNVAHPDRSAVLVVVEAELAAVGRFEHVDRPPGR